MKYKLLFFAFVLIFPLSALALDEETKNLAVPFIPEVHDGIWLPPWNNACEESSITMIDQYYSGIKSITVSKARSIMLPLFDIEDEIFGSHTDTDAARTAELANREMNFYAYIKDDPSIDDIKAQIREGHPIVSMHYGFGLNNAHHRFRRGGSSYHTLVISGFDEATDEFIVQDSGGYSGSNHRYIYETIMNTMHDFDHLTGRADGPKRAVFTVRRMLAKAEGSNRIYFITDKTRHYVTHPDLFKKFGWQWRKVKVVTKEFIDSMNEGAVINFDTNLEEFGYDEIHDTPDRIVKTADSTRIYLIRNNYRHYITHPALFKVHGWLWSSVEIVSQAWLDSLPQGEAIRE